MSLLDDLFGKMQEGANKLHAENMAKMFLMSDEEEIEFKKKVMKEIKTKMKPDPEEHDMPTRMTSAMHFRQVAQEMPMLQSWICDIFVMATGILVLEGDVEGFIERMEKLTDYVVRHRRDFVVD